MDRATQLDTWSPIYSGKVRDLYTQTGEPERVLVVASDRVSAYDHILQTAIPDKGAILTAMTLWWFERLADKVQHHGEPLENHVLSLDVPAEVAGRAMICRRLDMVPVECVARGYLTGSGLVDYRATGQVCGNRLPDGLTDGSRLPAPIFTPATKAAVGEHDENIGFDQVRELVGGQADDLRQLTLEVYSTAEAIAAEAGIVLADTKLEFGTVPGAGSRLILADEVLTPDSSRFWPAEEWRPGQPQPSFDKQIVRDWLTSPASGWDRNSDEPPPPLPDHVVERTRDRYLEAYRRLTGRTWQ